MCDDDCHTPHGETPDHNTPDYNKPGRRSFLAAIAGAATAATALTAMSAGNARADARAAGDDPYADPVNPVLVKGGMKLDPARAALVVIDPQIDFMSPKGLAWPYVGESVTEHNVVPNLGRLFEAAKKVGIPLPI
ncbi:MAG: hypothetical protein ABWY00_13765 [Dongiaceae bacterium]